MLADLPDDGEPLELILGDTLGLTPPIVLNGDQWDGYQAEQQALGDRLARSAAS